MLGGAPCCTAGVRIRFLEIVAKAGLGSSAGAVCLPTYDFVFAFCRSRWAAVARIIHFSSLTVIRITIRAIVVAVVMVWVIVACGAPVPEARAVAGRNVTKSVHGS